MKKVILDRNDYTTVGPYKFFTVLPDEEIIKATDKDGAILINHDNGLCYIVKYWEYPTEEPEICVYPAILSAEESDDYEATFKTYQELFECFCDENWKP